jgi:sugar phosphate isomerase/epimerase
MTRSIDQLSFQLYSAHAIAPPKAQFALLSSLGYTIVKRWGALFNDAETLKRLLQRYGIRHRAPMSGSTGCVLTRSAPRSFARNWASAQVHQAEPTSEEARNENDQGTGNIPRPVRWRHGAVQFLGSDLRVGRLSPLQGDSDPELGWAAFRSQEGIGVAGLRRRGERRRSRHGLAITELSTHLQGQLVAVHPAYDAAFDGFAAPEVRGNAKARTEWAVDQVKRAILASRRLGLLAQPTFSGALAWPYVYPWPQRPPGLIEAAFDELAKRWRPILDYADEHGVDLAYEIHPGEDLHDGISYEMFLDRVKNHPRANLLYDPSHFVLQQLDYLDYIDIYHDRIKAFHVKDAEFNPSGRQGVYGGFQSWADRAGRFRSLGDGQVDFGGIFSKLTQYDYASWAVLEWECALKHPEQGAREGAEFIKNHIIRVTEKAFDDFASSGSDDVMNRKMLGIS